MLQGTFALAIIFDGENENIYATRNVSPIVCNQNEKGAYIASDIIAIGQYSRDYFVLPEMTVAKISKNKIEIKDFLGNEIKPQMLKLDWDINESTKGGYPFYMEKEICEQPKVLKKTIEKELLIFCLTSAMTELTTAYLKTAVIFLLLRAERQCTQVLSASTLLKTRVKYPSMSIWQANLSIQIPL